MHVLCNWRRAVSPWGLWLLALTFQLPFAHAQHTIADDLNGSASNYPWQSIGGACLTAGDGTGSIPSCQALNRIGTPDAAGKGVLRLTDANRYRAGALLSKFTFPSKEGLQVRFTTVTWGGDSFLQTGADGLSFFLLDGDRIASIDNNTPLGSFGGSLGYSHAHGGTPGIQGGYLGVGIDEHGNFSNPRDNGIGGPGFSPNMVAVRGGEAGGYRYIAGSQVLGPIANSAALRRDQATPITFDLRISRDGRLNVAYSRAGGIFNPVISDLPIARDNGVLPGKFYFGFAGSTGFGTNIHEIMCFKAGDLLSSGSSAATNLVQAAKVQLGSQLYLAHYRTDGWVGTLTAQSLQWDPVTRDVSINPVATWDANCGLTGGACAATGQEARLQGPHDRSIVSFDGQQGIPFRWDRLATTQRVALGAAMGAAAGSATVVQAQDRLNYLRGDRRAEREASGPFRTRRGILGDIMHSSPTWVGPARSPAEARWTDTLHPQAVAAEGSSYRAFFNQVATRANVVYVGANDGMLHGFRAGAYTAQSKFDMQSVNDGRELLAYMPNASVVSISAAIPQLDYSHPQYAHNAYVDAAPGVGDLYFQNAWHTWLVSGMGGGGNRGGVLGNTAEIGTGAIFALDVSDPAAFSEANAASLVKGEWNASNLRCVNDKPNKACGAHFGNSYGTPIVRRLHDGNWAMIFGNGFHSATGHAGVFVLSVDKQSGMITPYFLDTGTGTSQRRNGIAYVSDLDLDQDRITDYLYAGDLAGNVWRFDLTSTQPAQWQARERAVFHTDGAPITTQVLANVVHKAGMPGRVILTVGTGHIIPQTLDAAAIANPQSHHLFGIWDWDMTSWNQRSPASVHALLPGSPGLPGTQTLGAQHLQTQTLTTHADTTHPTIAHYRTITQKPVCWQGASDCVFPSQNNRFGWSMPLPERHEQIVYNPVMVDGLVHVSTAIPALTSNVNCSPEHLATGFTMAFSPDEGAASPMHFTGIFALPDATRPPIAGLGLGAVGTPSFITANGYQYLVTQTSLGAPSLVRIHPTRSLPDVKRVTWKQIR